MQSYAEHVTALQGLIFIVGCLFLAVATQYIHFGSLLAKRWTLVVILAVTGAALWLTTPATPATSTVDGIYQNPCCAPISLQDGVFMTAGQKVRFKLELTKFGLVANLNVPVEVRGSEVVAAKSATTSVLVFSDDLTSIIVCAQQGHCGVGREYSFVKK